MTAGVQPIVTAGPARDEAPLAGPDELRRVFRRHAAAVTAVTASYRDVISQLDVPVGLLVTSLASVSADPPLISFNVSTGASSWPVLASVEHVGVHVLGADQQELAARFARSGAQRFAAPTSWRPGPHATPLLDGVAAWAVARVEQRVRAGDHAIVVARLLYAGTDGGTRDGDHEVTGDGLDRPGAREIEVVGPLLHHDGGYRRIDGGVTRAGQAPRLTVVRDRSA